MITRIKINGFKSFHNFEMQFTPFTVIAGTNASGKSNLFDALRLLSRLTKPEKLKVIFNEKERRGDLIEQFTQYEDGSFASEMEFEVEMLVNKTVRDEWGNEETLKYTRLRYGLTIRRITNSTDLEELIVVNESLVNLKHGEDIWIKLISEDVRGNYRPKIMKGKRGVPYIKTDTNGNGDSVVIVSQDGVSGRVRRYPLKNATRTVLSSIDSVDFKHCLAVKEEMKNWIFLQLNPEDLRQPTNKNSGEDTITSSGKYLAAALHRIKLNDSSNLKEISRKLNEFLPNYTEVDVVDDVENKQYLIKLRDIDKKPFSSRVLSEGTLRILALCILEYDNKHTGTLCFEEPENGIHSFRVKMMVELLKELSTDFSNTEIPLRQVIINTHSIVFIAELAKFLNENITIFFSEMHTFTDNINDKRMKMKITKVFRVHNENQLEFLDKISEQDKKISITKIKELLDTSDFEQVKKNLTLLATEQFMQDYLQKEQQIFVFSKVL